MQTKSEPSGARARDSFPVSLLSKLIQQGVDGYVATQRIVLDLMMRQNATTVNALRERLSVPKPTTAGLAEMAGEGMSNFIDAQRVLLNVALQQNEILMNGVKERLGDTRAGVVVNLMRRSVETFIDMQQHFLTIAAKQTDAWMESARSGKADPARSLAELARDAMEQFVRSQKKFLDVIAEEAANAANAGKDEGGEMKTGEDLAELARKSADSVIDMQKKLLDVAGKQVDLNFKAARHAMELMPSARLDLADLTRQYVENFVGAQKALLDVMMRPRPAVAVVESTRPTPRRARRSAV